MGRDGVLSGETTGAGLSSPEDSVTSQPSGSGSPGPRSWVVRNSQKAQCWPPFPLSSLSSWRLHHTLRDCLELPLVGFAPRLLRLSRERVAVHAALSPAPVPLSWNHSLAEPGGPVRRPQMIRCIQGGGFPTEGPDPHTPRGCPEGVAPRGPWCISKGRADSPFPREEQQCTVLAPQWACSPRPETRGRDWPAQQVTSRTLAAADVTASLHRAPR